MRALLLTFLLGLQLLGISARADVAQTSINTDAAASAPNINPTGFLPGHNLTPTSYVLKEKETTLGSYAVGYGITDRLTIATSPFIIGFYNTMMGELRYAIVQNGNFQATVEGMYFQSLDYANLGPHAQYQQRSGFLRFTASQKLSESYTLHLSTGHQYFWDDTAPYSLDPNPHQNKYLVSVSMLNEIHFNPHFGMFAEAGVLGLNYNSVRQANDVSNGIFFRADPYLHLGLSFFYQSDKMMIQLGVSRSSSTIYPTFDIYQGTVNTEKFESVLYHPEAMIQFYL